MQKQVNLLVHWHKFLLASSILSLILCLALIDCKPMTDSDVHQHHNQLQRFKRAPNSESDTDKENKPLNSTSTSTSASASASASTSTSTSASASKSFELQCLRQHNKWRRLHKAGPLKIDPKITKFAQQRADHIAASDGAEFKHPDELDYGENLAWHSDAKSSCAKLIKMWYDEVKLYSYKEAVFTHEAGHFTQLVWRDTHRVGCARAFSSGPRGGVYLVCNYDPPGNWKGEFNENVKPASKKSKKNKNKKNKNKKKNSNLTDNSTTTSTTADPTTTTQ